MDETHSFAVVLSATLEPVDGEMRTVTNVFESGGDWSPQGVREAMDAFLRELEPDPATLTRMRVAIEATRQT